MTAQKLSRLAETANLKSVSWFERCAGRRLVDSPELTEPDQQKAWSVFGLIRVDGGWFITLCQFSLRIPRKAASSWTMHGINVGKLFSSTSFKSMNEDLEKVVDDNCCPNNMGMQPQTWKSLARDWWKREERYRLKMDKKRTTKSKLIERTKYGYKKKSLEEWGAEI